MMMDMEREEIIQMDEVQNDRTKEIVPKTVKKGFRKEKTGDYDASLRRISLLLAFLAPYVIMLAIFIGNGIYPFGDRSFLTADLYHQYMPFFRELLRKIGAGEGLDYSWNVGMGSNFLALYGYYLASPFHWLAFWFPAEHLMEFISYLVVIKVGLAGFCACLYFNGRVRREGASAVSYSALLFSCFYALSGFMAAYNYNIMWLDCIVIAPIVLMGLERLVYQGKIGLYVIALALCIYSNFYISIMICIFLVLYFAFLFLTEPYKLRMLWRFELGSLLAGGLAGILLVPEVCALLATDFGEVAFPKTWKTYFSVLEILARHCMGITTEKALEHWPNIYCGCAVFLLVPLYVFHDEVPMKKRFGFMSLVGLFLLSFGINGLDFIWHGMNYPDSLPARQSFLYILVLLIMCHDCLVHFDKIPEKRILKVYLGAVTLLLVIQKFLQSDDFHTWDWLMTLGFVTAYAVCLYLYRTKTGRKTRYALAMVGFVLVLSESAINMSLTSVGTIDRAAYFEHVEDYKRLYDRYAKQEDFQRFEKYGRKTKNDAVLAGFPSASVFSSTLNSYVMDFYTKMGMQHSKVYYCYDGATAFSSALLNVGYLLSESYGLESELYKRIDLENGICLYEANYKLPFGYVAPMGFDLPNGLKYNGVSIQNEMMEQLGIDGILLQKVKANDEGDNVLFTPSQDGIYYGMLTDSGTTKIKMTGEDIEEASFKDLKKDCLIYLGKLKEGSTITLSNADKEDKTPNVSVAVYRLNVEVLEQAIELLGKEHLTQVKLDNTDISGHLQLERGGRLILTVPYEKGWKVTVNGVEREPQKFGNAFLALDLDAGTYDVALHYVPYGKGEGIRVTVVSAILFFGGSFALALYRKKAGKKILTNNADKDL